MLEASFASSLTGTVRPNSVSTRRLDIRLWIWTIAVLLPGLPLAGIGQQVGRISKDQVLAVLKSIDAGERDKNATAIVANIATNAVLTSTIDENGHKDLQRYDGAEYKRILEISLKEPGPVTVKRSHVAIEVWADGKTARATSIIVEDYQFEGKMKHGVTQESATFELIQGKVLVTKMDSLVTVK
jgi:hypothetical protein